MKKDFVLMCWDAPQKGIRTLYKVLDSFINNSEKKEKIDSVLYIYTENLYNEDIKDEQKATTKNRIDFLIDLNSKNDFNIDKSINQKTYKNLWDLHQSLKNNNKEIDFIPFKIPSSILKNADSFSEVEKSIRACIIPALRKIDPKKLYITIESGTVAMRNLWVSLYAQSFFNAYLGDIVSLWAFPDDMKKKDKTNSRPPISKLDIKQNPYVENIQNSTFGEKNKGIDNNFRYDNSEIIKSATVNAPMLLLGERGTGKSTIVENDIYYTKLKKKFIKQLNDSKNITTIVCGTLDGNLIDDMLFGHWKGAFTGANTNEEGAFEKCKDGLLFLDEIQDLPRSTQRKILRALNEKKILRLGHPSEDNKEDIEVNFSLVCASNKTLKELQEKLDPDFFDRVAMYTCYVKPVRDRSEKEQEELWKSTWMYLKKKQGLIIPETPDNFSLVKHALQRSKMYGNIRDIQQLIYYIARDVYEGVRTISNNKKTTNYNAVLRKWEAEYREKYPDQILSDTEISKSMLKEYGWKGMDNLFKQWLSAYSERLYGSKEEASKELNVDPKTLNNAKRINKDC